MIQNHIRMKIIFITGTMRSGGAERVISILSSQLIEHYEVDILCYYSAPIFYNVDYRVNIVDITKEWQCNTHLCKLISLRKYVKSQKKSVVISFMMPFYIFSAISLLGIKTPFIAAERSDPNSAPKIRQILSKLLMFKYDVLVTQTQGAKSFFENKNNCELRVIYNPINPSLINVKHEDPEEKHFISLSRFVPEKNQKLLISAFKKVLGTYPNCKLTIYGEGPLRDNLQAQIDNLGIHNEVALPGITNDIVEAFCNASVYVCSSNHEGMPNSVIEAMVCGMPTISTRVMGSIDLIQDGENGLLVEIGNEKELANAMLKLITDKDMRRTFSNEARNIANLLDTDKIVKQWVDTIEYAINNRYN